MGAAATLPRAHRRVGTGADRAFRLVALLAAGALLGVLAVMAARLWQLSAPTWQQRGAQLLTGTRWAPSRGSFGTLPFVYGTLLTATIATILAAPVAVTTALFLTEAAPRHIRQILATCPA